MMVQRGYVALRKDAYDQREWFDMATWSGSVPITLAKAKYQDNNGGGLACASPVIRIQKVECRALDEHVDIGPDGRPIEKKE